MKLVGGLLSVAALVLLITLYYKHDRGAKPTVQLGKKDGKEINCFLLVLVISGVTGADRRKAVRNTWIKETRRLQPKVDTRFVIGTDGLSNEDLISLRVEQGWFGDLVFLRDVHDNYHNLTRKVRNAYVWLVQHAEFSYVLKTDDDTFIAVKPLLEELVRRPKPGRLYWGYMHTNYPVLRDDERNAEPNWFMCQTYIQYASGAGYILSADAVQAIANNVHMLQLYENEDVSVSTWLSGFLLERRHDTRFNIAMLPCQRDQVLSHWLSTSDMYNIYRHYQKNGTLCEPVRHQRQYMT